MKKFLSLLMALTMLMACTACFGSAESASDPAAYDGSEVNITFYNTCLLYTSDAADEL